MKIIPLAAIAVAVAGLSACSVNTGHARPTSWGKEGVSKLDYQTDGILCATLAERVEPGNAGKVAGGLSGSNAGGGGGGASGSGGSQGGGSLSTLGGGTYRETAPPDVVNRAANQQVSREMQVKQLRMDALRSCLVERGYTEFTLTDEERAKVDSLPQGSDERTNYLYKLGTNPEILKARAVKQSATAAAK